MRQPSNSGAHPRRAAASAPPRAGRRLAGLLAVPVLLGLAFAPPEGTSPTTVQDPEPTAPIPRHGGFIGRIECIECHADQDAAIATGSHHGVVHLELMQSCETCHGPAKNHADDEDNDTALITFPPKLGPQAQQKLCGRCHQSQIRNHGGDLAGFFAAGKRCTDCHQVHTKKKPTPFPGTTLRSHAETVRLAKPVGAAKCVTCHPLRNAALQGTGHAHLATKLTSGEPTGGGCEYCHGAGSLHVQTGGIARLISRPDTATDGVATCRSCHEAVDPREFHWKDKHQPLLSKGMTCATCHTVHRDPTRAGPNPDPGQRTKATGAPAMAAATASASTVTTNSTCAKCHAPAFDVLHNTIHESLGEKDVPLAQGCGSCHSGAAEHARSGGRKALVQSMRGADAAAQLASCVQCHAKDHALRHARSGAHFRNEVTCLSCHSPAARKGTTRHDASQRCAKCHPAAAAEFRLPNHHPVDVTGEHRGGMACVDCHDPHSARKRIRDRQLRQNTCVKCHKEYRGPFVYNHQASRTEGCVVCHAPHGSTNRRMLKQHTSQQNCLQCHGDFPSFHDQTKGAVFTDCLKCHTEVHGSNHSRYLLR